MRSTFLRSLVSIFVIFVIVISAFLIMLTGRVRDMLIDQFAENLKNLSIISEPTCIQLIKNNIADETRATTARMGKDLGIRVTLIDTTGLVLADSDHDPKTMDNHLGRPEIKDARAKGFGKSMRYSRTIDTDFLYVAKRLVDSRPVGYVRFSIPLTAIQSFYKDTRKWIFVAGMILLFLATVIVYFYSTYLRQPIRNIREFSTELSSGDFSSRILKPAKGDVVAVYKDLNRMAEKLEESFKVIAEERDTVTGVLSAMIDGVCVINKEWKVMICNESFQKMFSAASSPLNKDVTGVVRQASFLDLISKCKTDKSHKTVELEIADKGLTYLVNGFHLPGTDGWVFAFSDITKAKNLERIKADFITNLSHELRTPLTAIRGYVETLEDPGTSQADRDKFLKIIHNNTERLVNIVADLLTLSDFERAGREVEYSRFDLNELANDVIVLFNNEAKKKRLKLLFAPGSLPQFTGDRFMIQQLLINLISNGLRFTEKGEVKIEIDHQENEFHIIVSDTGAGIPGDEIPRIFERFYTVDKARSRAHGGTGLGLAIVKHIVQAHGGEIKVESRISEGSKFTVILPVLPQ
jgi:two-component system phosphate regulon sensor histidine kinase PhoR